jgi:uridine phosphorylase
VHLAGDPEAVERDAISINGLWSRSANDLEYRGLCAPIATETIRIVSDAVGAVSRTISLKVSQKGK